MSVCSRERFIGQVRDGMSESCQFLGNSKAAIPIPFYLLSKLKMKQIIRIAFFTPGCSHKTFPNEAQAQQKRKANSESALI
ncbi:MAG: hypothetical protein R2769_05755 [Saprospiraceae bacterium]